MRDHKLLAVLAMFAFLSPDLTRAEDQPIEVQIVDALNKVFGVHPGFRANHAKGIVVEGSFKASANASALSKASLFDGSPIPVTVRFSDATGLPDIPDGSAKANPHGMAIKFHLQNGEETDMVLNSLKFFPVADGIGFRDLQLAIAASPPGAPTPTKFDEFKAEHPTVMAALATLATPDSFADEQYNGIDAFVLVDKVGGKHAVRYRMVPERIVHLDAGQAASKPSDFLVTELPERLKRGPITFHLKAQLADPGDPTKDATQPWPEDRRVVDLGTLTVDKAVADSAKAEKELLFLPGRLADGIEPSDDPLIELRDGAYAELFSRRNH